jgi:elongator complex protein 2
LFIHAEAACIQTIKMSPGFCLDVKMSILPKSEAVILACALDNFKISLHVLEDGQFVKKENLAGHEDWITCLDWVTAGETFVLIFVLSCRCVK